MAGIRVHLQVIDEQTLKRLTRLDLLTRDMTPVMQDYDREMVAWRQRAFDAYGPPGRWAPLKRQS